MTGGEYHQHHFLLLFCAAKWLQGIDDNVKNVERSPGEEKYDADCYENLVYFLPSLHLPGSPVG